MTITEHDARWLASIGVVAEPTRPSRLAPVRRVLGLLAWLAVLGAIGLAFGIGVATLLGPVLGWLNPVLDQAALAAAWVLDQAMALAAWLW